MTSILNGIRVVDFTEGALGLAGAVLAEYGAEVVKVEPPRGDWARTSPGFLMWNRGKLGVVLDAAKNEDRATILQLVRAADVVIHAFDQRQANEYSLNWNELHESSKHLTVCRVSGFGEGSPYAALGSHERIVMAKSGRLMGNGPLSGAQADADQPIYITAPLATFGAAMLVVQGAVAALLARRRLGKGQLVSTSLVQGISAATMRLAFERRGNEIIPVAARDESAALVLRGIRLCFLTVETRDGRFIQMCCRQKRLYENWMKAIGLGELYQSERWADLPLGVRSYEDAEEWEAKVREHMKTRSQSEWMQLFRTIDIGADPFLTFDEFLQHPQMLENDRVRVIQDGQLGPVRQIGPLVHFERTPAECQRSAPRLGEHQHMVESLTWRHKSDHVVQPTAGRSAAAGALGGFIIIEAASFLATPLGPTLLAELGARVIKIEPLNGDPFRTTGLECVHIVNGKESLAVDLKTEEGRRILERVIARGDAFVHNFRPGVPEKLGMGYEEVSRLNPRMVYLYGASYGSKGPENHRAAFHSTPNALSGGGILQAGHLNRPVNDSYGDPCSGLVTGTALVLALWAREVLGKGQYLETSMLSNVGYVHSERLVRFAGCPTLPDLDHEQRGMHALDRLYPCKSGWIILSALSEPEWQGVAQLLDRATWLGDSRFGSSASRLENDAALTTLLEERFASADASAWERRAMEAGLPIASAAEGTFEEFLVHEGLVTSAEHHAFGTYWQLPPRLSMSETPTSGRAPCALGEHTIELLKELQFSDIEIAGFIQRGVVKSPEATGTASMEASSSRKQLTTHA